MTKIRKYVNEFNKLRKVIDDKRRVETIDNVISLQKNVHYRLVVANNIIHTHTQAHIFKLSMNAHEPQYHKNLEKPCKYYIDNNK